jgi:hypothetical protein
VRLAAEGGFDGLAVDATCPLDLLRPVATEGLRAGLAVALAACPLPPADLGKGKRLPHLGSFDDPDERAAAVKLGRATLEAGSDLSVGAYLVDFGPVPLRTPEAELRLRFARREMQEGDPGHRVLRRALEERRAKGARLYDACRAALEPLLAAAERRGAVLCLPVATGPWQQPSPREAQALLREFAGAPLSIAASPAGRGVLAALGLEGPAPRWDELGRVTRVLLANDQVGLEGELLLGLGELSTADLARAWPAEAGAGLQVAIGLGGPIDASFKEVLRARRRAGELAEQAARQAAARAAETAAADAATRSGKPEPTATR